MIKDQTTYSGRLRLGHEAGVGHIMAMTGVNGFPSLDMMN